MLMCSQPSATGEYLSSHTSSLFVSTQLYDRHNLLRKSCTRFKEKYQTANPLLENMSNHQRGLYIELSILLAYRMHQW